MHGVLIVMIRRYILANTEELHAQIDALTIRVRELEHGLSLLQATVSSEPHPLLENRSSPVGSTPNDVAEESMEGNVQEEDVVEAFGTFTHCFPQTDVTLTDFPQEPSISAPRANPRFWEPLPDQMCVAITPV